VGAAFAIVFPPADRSHDTKALLVSGWQPDATSSITASATHMRSRCKTSMTRCGGSRKQHMRPA